MGMLVPWKVLVTTSVIRGAADLYFPATPVSAGLGFQHPDLHVGARAYLMLLDECSQHTANNGSRAIANLWDAEWRCFRAQDKRIVKDKNQLQEQLIYLGSGFIESY